MHGPHHDITVATQAEAETLKRLLYANGQNFEIAQHAVLEDVKRVPTVAEVIQEHIDMPVPPSSGTVKTCQTMLDLHVRKVFGGIPVDKLDYRAMTFWVQSMLSKGRSPKTMMNVFRERNFRVTGQRPGWHFFWVLVLKDPCSRARVPSVSP